MKFLLFTITTFIIMYTNNSEAGTHKIKDTFKIEVESQYYPSVSIGKSSNNRDFKIGVNLIMFHDFCRYKKTNKTNFNIDQKTTPQWVYDNDKTFLPILTLNHHFIKDYNDKRVNCQSLEYVVYSEYLFFYLVGVGAQIKHYDFKTISISPQIRILPPFVNFYIQRNFHQSKNLPIPKYEFGIEFNPRILYYFSKNPLTFGL